MIDWQRHRLPEDVPTPVAVAVSDFCRRAKAPAPAAVVREALALLPEADDFRVRALTDAEPEAQPLGPFAVIDMVRGTAPELAAQRQQTGYYDMVRAVAEEQARAAPPPITAPPPERVVPFPAAAPQRPRGEEEKKKKGKKGKGPSIAERIAPKRRVAGEQRAAAAPVPGRLPATAYLPKRQLPAPRGRFTRLDPSRASIHALTKPEGAETLSALIGQLPHRYALLKTLSQGYLGRGGAELSVGDVEGLLDRHGLRARLEAKERDTLLGSILEQKGALGRAAHALGMRPKDLEGLLKHLRITREAKEIQERAIRDALSPRNLPARLELVSRTRYLEDLGIARRFRERLHEDLEVMVNAARDEATSAPALVDLLARRHALNADALRRALDALGLLDPTLSSPARKA
ncbi:MAG: hypothetical protein AB1730_18660 [Myxococcota bacterium]